MSLETLLREIEKVPSCDTLPCARAERSDKALFQMAACAGCARAVLRAVGASALDAVGAHPDAAGEIRRLFAEEP